MLIIEERHSLVLWRGFGTWLIMNPCIFSILPVVLIGYQLAPKQVRFGVLLFLVIVSIFIQPQINCIFAWRNYNHLSDRTAGCDW